ncbi:hypothetical protein JHK85_045216 [Glycine max]|nr:hypothetical protein JHK85_045216 [Glycine max]
MDIIELQANQNLNRQIHHMILKSLKVNNQHEDCPHIYKVEEVAMEEEIEFIQSILKRCFKEESTRQGVKIHVLQKQRK